MPRPQASERPDRERRLVRLLCPLFALEALLNTIVAPLLPHYADTLHASDAAIGMFASSYGLGGILFTLLAAAAVHRPGIGVRRTTLAGLALLIVSSAPFGVVQEIVWLDLLRFLHGAAAGCLWMGGLTWLIDAIAPERRGAALGTALGAGIVGNIIGPALGALGLAVGTDALFGAVALAGLALAVPVLRTPAPTLTPAARRSVARRRPLRVPSLVAGAWIVLLATTSGSGLTVLGALRLHDLGASEALIGASFLMAAVLATILTPLAGRAADRHGPLLPIAAGLSVTAPLLLGMPRPASAVVLAIVLIAALALATGPTGAPGSLLITRGAELAGFSLAGGIMLINICYSLGAIVGPVTVTRLVEATTFSVPCILLAAASLATLLTLLAWRRQLTAGA